MPYAEIIGPGQRSYFSGGINTAPPEALRSRQFVAQAVHRQQVHDLLRHSSNSSGSLGRAALPLLCGRGWRRFRWASPSSSSRNVDRVWWWPIRHHPGFPWLHRGRGLRHGPSALNQAEALAQEARSRAQLLPMGGLSAPSSGFASSRLSRRIRMSRSSQEPESGVFSDE